jgi:beta-galactosidase
VIAWQTDNEYGCHDTTISYSPMAARRFRFWLRARYGEIAALNSAWGNVFWSQEYRAFEEIDPPTQTVTEANPAHRLDYNRFASDEVVRFNRAQTEILRRHAPGRDILHNFMGFYTEFDHFDVARDLDVAAWDSYPLGFLEQFWFSAEEKARYLRQGHPDIAAFHHDLYRGVGRGRWQVIEQQPGPVNWAAYNPAPLPGMVRLWTWEAFAHGAEAVSYFRWRQAPFGQEQYHAGLLRPDRSEDVGATEARAVAAELERVGALAASARAKVALVFSYEADWLMLIQPQGGDFRWLCLAFEVYSALRRVGLDVDIVDARDAFAGYDLIVVPSLPIVPAGFLQRVQASGAVVVFGPRSGSKTEHVAIPDRLAPGALAELIPARVLRVESLPPGAGARVLCGDRTLASRSWREHIGTSAETVATFEDGGPAWIKSGSMHYLAAWPEPEFFDAVIAAAAVQAKLETQALPEGVRLRRRGGLRFAFNYAPEPRETPAPKSAAFALGGPLLPPAGVAAWREA